MARSRSSFPLDLTGPGDLPRFAKRNTPETDAVETAHPYLPTRRCASITRTFERNIQLGRTIIVKTNVDKEDWPSGHLPPGGITSPLNPNDTESESSFLSPLTSFQPLPPPPRFFPLCAHSASFVPQLYACSFHLRWFSLVSPRTRRLYDRATLPFFFLRIVGPSSLGSLEELCPSYRLLLLLLLLLRDSGRKVCTGPAVILLRCTKRVFVTFRVFCSFSLSVSSLRGPSCGCACVEGFLDGRSATILER